MTYPAGTIPMMLLADIGNHELEDLIVCLVIVGVVTLIVYLVLVHGLHQAWGAMAAGIIFLIGALLCFL